MNINQIKRTQIQEIIDFYYFIEEYGHIYHLDPDLLDEPFEKIMSGMREIREMINESYSM